MSDFKDKVVEIISKIPQGRVTTYGTVSVLAGAPRSARIVGGILHTDSEKFNLPWYRVINRHGFISIRSAGNSKEVQKTLLESEGIEVSSGFMVDLDKYGWWG